MGQLSQKESQELGRASINRAINPGLWSCLVLASWHFGQGCGVIWVSVAKQFDVLTIKQTCEITIISQVCHIGKIVTSEIIGCKGKALNPIHI